MLSCVYQSALGVLVLLGLATCYDCSNPICGVTFPGDIMIGILQPYHSKVESSVQRMDPTMLNCTGFNLVSFVRTMAVIYTIDSINNSTFLPGVRLGYTICDTCSDASIALQATEKLLAINGTLLNQCYLSEQPAVKVIIGSRYSEESIVMARLLKLYMMPQISTTSSAAILSDRHRFPSFLRTIPSDIHQTFALAQLMAHFDWNWVGVVSSDDDYGKDALQSFLAEAAKANVCTDFQDVVPYNLNDINSRRRIQEVADHINASNAKVVLLILKEELVQKIFEEMLGKGIKRIWIASDAWSVSRTLAKMNGINKLGDIFGFNFITGPMPGFQQYLERLLHNANPVNKFIEEYKNLRCSPEVQQCLLNKSPSQCPLPSSVKSACNMSNFQEDNDDYLTSNVDLKLAYGEKLATWSIAIALRSLLQCNESICSADRNFPPWKLFQELTKINFSMDNGHYYFDNTGAFINGYDLINWARNADERIFKVVGKFNLMENAVEINPHNEIEWENANKTIPVSKCSDSCPPGTQKKLYMVSCCYNCTKCEAGTFSNVSNLENCWKCPIGTWALKGWDHCEKRSDAYFKWNEPFAITIISPNIVWPWFYTVRLMHPGKGLP
ncbi:hypothetical protein UPYG_G00233560 [Umbra pygmaea]|uniref:G-protein coupled receptors family 3 profile domain-containing protein n=1 Tax=Umbra pygmaea TaxID=75934 RepID=A0ABD0WFJ8_UMBPY